MTPEQALQTLDQAVAQLAANRETHVALQASVSVLRDALPRIGIDAQTHPADNNEE